MNPLHALLNRGDDVSPYSPVSRLFRNPLYIDVARVPELEHAPELSARIGVGRIRRGARGAARDRRRALRAGDGGEGPRARRAPPHIRRARSRFGQRPGSRLRGVSYARRPAPSIASPRGWPSPSISTRPTGGRGRMSFSMPRVKRVARFAREHATRIDFHRWVQFEVDRQLGAAASNARRAGMRIGLYQDLAIGSVARRRRHLGVPGTVRSRRERWRAAGSVCGERTELGSSADRSARAPSRSAIAISSTSPKRLSPCRRAAHRSRAGPLSAVLDSRRAQRRRRRRTSRYPADDLLGILALESVRHGALVVGEDLGTVPPSSSAGARESGACCRRRCCTSSANGMAGSSRRAAIRALSLATANTHDMPTIAGFWAGRDIERAPRARSHCERRRGSRARAERDRDRGALLGRLEQEQILPQVRRRALPQSCAAPCTRFLCRTPAQLVGLSLDDLAGEVEPVNVPGRRTRQVRELDAKDARSARGDHDERRSRHHSLRNGVAATLVPERTEQDRCP